MSAAVIIMLTYGASAIVGLLRDRLLAATFFGGREWQLDVYFAAFLIPDTIFQLVVIGALSAAFIPIFSQLVARNQEKDAWYIASASMTVMMTVFGLMSLVLAIFAGQVSHLIAPGFTGEKLDLMVGLVRIMMIAQVFFAFSGFLGGVLQAYQRFLVPALAPILYNVGIIFGILILSPFWGIYGAAVGVIVGSFLHLVIQIFPARRLGFSPKPIWDLSHPAVREIGRLMIPRTLALGVDRIEQFVAVFLATMLADGSLSLFNFARHIYLLPASLFGATIGQASLPVLASQAGNDKETFKRTFSSSLLQILYFTVPAGVVILVLRIPLVRIVFGAKSFPWPATILTGQAVALFSLSIAAQAAIQLLIRGFYAFKNTRIPLAVGVISAILNLGLSMLFTYEFGLGIRGLALSISLAGLFEAVALFFMLNRIVGGLMTKQFWNPVLKIIAASVIMGVSLWLLMRYLDRIVFDTTKTSSLIILTIIVSSVGMLIYLLLSWLLKLEQLRAIFALVGKLGHWRKILAESEEVLESSTAPTSPT